MGFFEELAMMRNAIVEIHKTFFRAPEKPAKMPPKVYTRPYISGKPTEIRANPKRKYFFWPRCDKCGRFLRKGSAIHHEDIDEDLCPNCSDLLKIYRGDY